MGNSFSCTTSVSEVDIWYFLFCCSPDWQRMGCEVACCIQNKAVLLCLPVTYTVWSLAIKSVARVLSTETSLVCLGVCATLHTNRKDDTIINNNCSVSDGGDNSSDNSSMYYNWDTRWRSYLRHCAASWKVAGSIPDGRSMTLGLIQPLTEMSIRNIS